MGRNTEIKAKLDSIEAAITELENLSTEGPFVLFQEDTFYNTEKGRLKWRRMPDREELIYYHRPDTAEPCISQYRIVDVSKQSQLKEVLGLALGMKGQVKKKRTLYLVGQTRVHLDEVEGLGSFMELEVVLREDQTEKEGQEIAHTLMKKLGIQEQCLLDSAYIDML
ncbi:MAG: adenylate cyclase [Acidobacteria bacterium]|nr:MAG: adenylate cyclase [Acidobacteriota bacterium]